MAWFRKKHDPVDREIREVEKELRRLKAEMRRLQREPAKPSGTFKPAATTLPPNYRPPAEPSAPQSPQPQPAPLPAREPDLWSRHATPVHANPPMTWSAWWRSLFGPRQGPSDPRLVSYLSTGSFKTVRPLRYERRVARNRYLFSLAFLIIALLLLMFALKNC